MIAFHQISSDSLGSRMHRAINRGFTLAEVMVATSIFVLLTLGISFSFKTGRDQVLRFPGIYELLIKSYEMTAVTRCSDDGRAVLASYGDQFLRLQTTDDVTITNPDGTLQVIPGCLREFFKTTTAATGQGLNPVNIMSDTNSAYFATSGAITAGLQVTIGGPGLAIPAQVTRQVQFLDPSTGAVSATKIVATSGGYMMLATYKISYNVYGNPHSQSLSVVRYIP